MNEALSNLDHREKRVVEAIRNLGGEATRREITVATGMPRTVISEVLTELHTRQVVTDGAVVASSGGRPARKVKLNERVGHLASIFVGGFRTRVALGHLDATILSESYFDMDVNVGPTKILDRAIAHIKRLQKQTPGAGELLSITVGLPAPIEAKTGAIVAAPLMGSWEGFDTKKYVSAKLGVTPLVENDVNLIAIGEHHWSFPNSEVLLAIKIGTGFGSGIVIGNKLIRGSSGVAGDIGHMPTTTPSDAVCRCGRIGCAEATGGGWAMVQAYNSSLASAEEPIESIIDFVELCRDKNSRALSIAREGTVAIGAAIADAVSLINPDTVVITGATRNAGDFVLATIREMVYKRAAPLATRDLVLTGSSFDHQSGVGGGLLMSSNQVIGTPIDEDEVQNFYLART